MTKIYYSDYALQQEHVIVLEKEKGRMGHAQVFPAEAGISLRQLEAFNQSAEAELDKALAQETTRSND
jgi:hypothetical protein